MQSSLLQFVVVLITGGLMPVKSDTWIVKMAREQGMIEPFAAEQVRDGISFGVSSYGYDFRLADEFLIPPSPPLEKGGEGVPSEKRGVLDPKDINHLHFKELKTPYYDIPPNSFCLGRSLEYFRIPRNVLAIVFGKSTYARCGVHINVTPFEPEWEGYATIAISNVGSLPARVYANEGIGQVIFLEADELCAVSYADKKGKYQGQKEITYSKI